MRNSSALLILAALCWSCEFSRNTNQESPGPEKPRLAGQVEGANKDPQRAEETPRPADPAEATPEEPRAEPASPATPPRRIDGRRSPPSAAPGAPVAHGTLLYAFGSIPNDLPVPNETLFIAPREAEPDRVAGADDQIQDPIVIELPDPLLEVALLKRGRRVLDRQALSILEHEHYFQFGHVEAGLAEKLGGAAGVEPGRSQDSSERLPRPTLGNPLVGREPYASYAGPLWWLFDGSQARPLLNGSQVAQEDSLPKGAFLSAKTLLIHEALESRESTLLVQARRPTAASIPHLPVLGQELLDPNQGGTDKWAVNKADPFQYKNSGDLVLFDPVRRSFWQLRDAWVGRVVSRKNYIEARTNDVIEVCPECGAEHTERVTPDYRELPTRWTCESCKESHEVVYLDGYRMEGELHPDNSTVLRAAWVSVAPGIYPLARTVAPGGDLTAGIVLPQAPSSPTEMRTMALGALATRYQRGFCWVRNDGSAVIVTPEEHEKLTSASGVEGWPTPALDGEGRQTFALAQEPYESTQVEVPLSSGGIRFRAIDVASGLVVLAGTIQRSYLEVLPSPRSISVGTAGADMSMWPSGPAQNAEIGRVLVDLLSSRFDG